MNALKCDRCGRYFGEADKVSKETLDELGMNPRYFRMEDDSKVRIIKMEMCPVCFEQLLMRFPIEGEKPNE